jgi:hypothetical protein
MFNHKKFLKFSPSGKGGLLYYNETNKILCIMEEINSQHSVSELIKYFNLFHKKYSVFGADELSNCETICRLKRMKKTRIFNAMNDEVNPDCILIWEVK